MKEEIDALLGLLYLTGYLRSNHLNLHNLWGTDGFSPEYFRAAMSKYCFSLLLRAVRFDHIETRDIKWAIDKLTPKYCQKFSNYLRSYFDVSVNYAYFSVCYETF